MRAVVLSSVFPSRTRPTYGVFIRERVRHVARHCDLAVVAPVPWFPGNGRLRGEAVATTPRVDVLDGVPVSYPRFVCSPLVGKTLDGLLYALSLAPVLARLRRRFPFDLIDAHFTYPDGVAAVMLGRAFSVPVVVTVRGSHDVRHAGYALRRSQIRAALRHATRVITVSQSLHDFVTELGVDGSRVRVIPNGVDAVRFLPSERTAARARVGLPQDRAILLSVGGLVEGKGHRRVIELLPTIVAKRPDLLLVVVGGEMRGTADRRNLEALATNLGVADYVRLVGARPHEEIPVWMAAADVFCLATRSEGWCNAMMEALACGVPVVTTRVGGNPELVRDGLDGFLVPFWDGEGFMAAILRALDTPWDHRTIAARARVNGWERTAEGVFQEFEGALSLARPPLPAPRGTRA